MGDMSDHTLFAGETANGSEAKRRRTDEGAECERPRLSGGSSCVRAFPSLLELRSLIPVSDRSREVVNRARQAVEEVLHNPRDARVVVITGPCSIHDLKAAHEYAKFLRTEQDKYKDALIILMRVYFEKPRSTVGWKGLINDPDLDGKCDIERGVTVARQLLADITNDYGVACATEFLDVYTAPYLSDFISWGAIGARTTESQIHREMVSGLPCPMGFKNGTSGDVQIAVDAVVAGRKGYRIMGISPEKSTLGIIETQGNQSAHVVLRGGKTGPNYQASVVADSQAKLAKLKPVDGQKAIPTKVVIDCSHGNSNKDFRRQPLVAEDIASQIQASAGAVQGAHGILGVMIESNLVEGNQSADLAKAGKLEYGKSVTDACVNLDTTRTMLETLAAAVRAVRT